jgi:hypothetical protein
MGDGGPGGARQDPVGVCLSVRAGGGGYSQSALRKRTALVAGARREVATLSTRNRVRSFSRNGVQVSRVFCFLCTEAAAPLAALVLGCLHAAILLNARPVLYVVGYILLIGISGLRVSCGSASSSGGVGFDALEFLAGLATHLCVFFNDPHHAHPLAYR